MDAQVNRREDGASRLLPGHDEERGPGFANAAFGLRLAVGERIIRAEKLRRMGPRLRGDDEKKLIPRRESYPLIPAQAGIQN